MQCLLPILNHLQFVKQLTQNQQDPSILDIQINLISKILTSNPSLPGQYCAIPTPPLKKLEAQQTP